MSGLLNPIKINHSSSFIMPTGEHSVTFNKNNEKIKMLELDLETSKDTIIKLRTELHQKNQEIKFLKNNNNEQGLEHQQIIKVIETIVKLIDPNIYKINKDPKSNTATYNTINHNVNVKEDENRKDTKETQEKELTINFSNLNKKNLTIKRFVKILRTEKSPKKFNMPNNKAIKDLSYINSLRNKANLLKELIIKKNDEIKEILKDTTNTENYSNLQDNFEKNYLEMESIKKQNELMKTKIEDMTNLLFMEKEGNKSLKTKLQVFQSNFKDYQENLEKKRTVLEAKLFKAQEKERDCRIFHINKKTEIGDGERLKLAEKEMKTIQTDIENMKKNIESKKEEIENLKKNKTDLEKQVEELKETNNKLNNENLNLFEEMNKVKNTKKNLEKDNKDLKQKYNTTNENLKNEQDKTDSIKNKLKQKEREILFLKKELEKLKKNYNFQDGTFFTSIGAKGKTKNEKLKELDVNIDEELAEIEKKYNNMLNQKEKEKEEEKNYENKNKDLENIKDEIKKNENSNLKSGEKIVKEDDLKDNELKEENKENDNEKKENEIKDIKNALENKNKTEKEEQLKEKENKEEIKEDIEKEEKKENQDYKQEVKKEQQNEENNESKKRKSDSEDIKNIKEILQYNDDELKNMENIENKKIDESKKEENKEIKSQKSKSKEKDSQHQQENHEVNKNDNQDEFIDFDINL